MIVSSATFWIIIAGAVLTYMTRIGGHLVLSRFERIHPRVEAGLDAVPAAVLTTVIAPVVLTAGAAELGAMLIAALVALRFSTLPMFLAGWVAIVVLRQLL